MSAAVRLSSKLPGENTTNGVDYLAADLVAACGEVGVLCLAIIDCPEYKHNGDLDVNIPLIRIRKIEAIGVLGGATLGDLQPVTAEQQKMFLDRAERRQGMKPLPFEALEGDENYEVTV